MVAVLLPGMAQKDDIKQIRIAVLQMIHKAKEGHIPSAFSVIEILYTLYAAMEKDDVFFLSKGHASAGLYAVLAHFGFLRKEDLDTFCKYDSKLGGHPHLKVPHIMNSSGSLGHGFPAAAGYALAKKIKGEPGRVFCLIGDGESNEGTIWETAMYGEQLNLNNLVCILYNNKSQTRAMTSVNLEDKFRAFGWKEASVDGHDLQAVLNSLFNDEVRKSPGPVCIVANTIKGKGVKIMETDMFSWHHKAPTDEELAAFTKEIING